MQLADPTLDPGTHYLLTVAGDAADRYVEAYIAERLIVDSLADTPVHYLADMTDAHNRVSRACRKAFKRLRRAIRDLNGIERFADATNIYEDVLTRLGSHRFAAAEEAAAKAQTEYPTP